MTSSARLDLSGMQNVNPVNMHMAVSAYLLPLLEAGWNSPIKFHCYEFHGFGVGEEKMFHFLSCCVFDIVFWCILDSLCSVGVLISSFLSNSICF